MGRNSSEEHDATTTIRVNAQEVDPSDLIAAVMSAIAVTPEVILEIDGVRLVVHRAP